MNERQALRNLVNELRPRVLDLPDHPWVPGGMFADGKLLAANERVLGQLRNLTPEDRARRIARMVAARLRLGLYAGGKESTR